MSKVAAVFLFNHRYEKNIDKLEAIYADRFSSRSYIMPFSDSPRDDVVGVYETSWNFSGHMAQAWPRIAVPGATHYAFIADDLILNPALNEHNLLETLGVGPDAGYIKSLASIDTNRYRWYRALQIAMAFDEVEPGFDFRAELPNAEEARARFEAMGIPVRFPKPTPLGSLSIKVHRVGPINYLRWAGRRTSYPLLYGYSDFIIVPASAMARFVRYCGILAALNVFAEVAVPTALALAVDEIETELAFGEHFFPVGRKRHAGRPEALELWGQKPITDFAEHIGFKLENLFAEFPANRLYVHPVKLSQFK